MRHRLMIAALASMSLLAACKQAEQAPAAETATPVESTAAPADDTAAASVDVAAWVGKWTGPEGMYATITPGTDGKISLEMQSDLDTKATYEGTAAADGISFKRGEETLVLKRATGDETGLRYLAGKKDCVMVKSGEGYCRD